MNKNILIITRQEDRHADIITDKLQERKVSVFRINTDKDNPQNVTISINGEEGVCALFNDLEIDRCIDLQIIHSVWFRKPTSPRNVHDVNTPRQISKYIDNETKEWMKSLCCVLENAFWVNNPLNLQKANRKISQLIMARSLGMRIPDTLISDDPKQIKKFFSKHSGSIVAKTFRTQFVTSEDGTSYLPRTQIISEKDLNNESFYSYPCIIQEKINCLFEVRAVVIGEKIFAFRIDSKNLKEFSDVRSLSIEELSHVAYNLSSETENKILGLVKSYGLHFSALDLLVTNDGKEVFLELNPNGQWLWLEIVTGINMSDSFCDLLLKNK